MNLAILNRQRDVSLPRGWLRKVCKKILEELHCTDAELSILLVNDKKMQALNRDYRKIDRPTDVLSFSMQEGEGFPTPNLLGDVVLSMETASQQANEHDWTIFQEVAHLLTHGVLHLLGFDHEVSLAAAKEMRDREIAILQSLIQSNLIPPGKLPDRVEEEEIPAQQGRQEGKKP